MTARVIPESWEPIDPILGGGWITPCPNGGKHLVGAAWGFFVCQTCLTAAQQSRRAEIADQMAALREQRETQQ